MINKIKELLFRKNVTIRFVKTVRFSPRHTITDIEIIEALLNSTMNSVYEIKKIDLSNRMNKIVLTCPKSFNKYDVVDAFLQKIGKLIQSKI